MIEKLKPRWDLADALRRAQGASRLLRKHTVILTPRLDAGAGEQLTADEELLGGTGDRGPLTVQKVATATERDVCEDGHDLVMAIREAVKRSPKGTDTLRKAVGVGDALRVDDTRGVIAALDSIGANAAGLRACGVVAADTDDAALLAGQLRGADTVQIRTKDARTDSTEDRVDAQLRMESAIDAIKTAGVLAFRKDAVIRARFERLVSSTGPSAADETDQDEEDEERLDPPVPD